MDNPNNLTAGTHQTIAKVLCKNCQHAQDQCRPLENNCLWCEQYNQQNYTTARSSFRYATFPSYPGLKILDPSNGSTYDMNTIPSHGYALPREPSCSQPFFRGARHRSGLAASPPVRPSVLPHAPQIRRLSNTFALRPYTEQSPKRTQTPDEQPIRAAQTPTKTMNHAQGTPPTPATADTPSSKADEVEEM